MKQRKQTSKAIREARSFIRRMLLVKAAERERTLTPGEAMTNEEMQKLREAEQRIAKAAEVLRRAEGLRDQLLVRSLDNEGSNKR